MRDLLGEQQTMQGRGRSGLAVLLRENVVRYSFRGLPKGTGYCNLFLYNGREQQGITKTISTLMIPNGLLCFFCKMWFW
jgi:hypothetical protein